MTEKEKMLKQMLYDANYDTCLLNERHQAKDLCYEFNHLRPSDEEGQQRIMKKLLGKTNGAFCIIAPFWCDYGYNIEIGENFFANHNTVILDCGKVTFGDNVFIGPDCGFHTAGHPIDLERRNKGLEYAYPITVGDNVWIGAGVHVMPGVTIGSNVVIGGGSVVVKDIPDNSVAVGNPCKVIRQITEEDKKKCWDKLSPFYDFFENVYNGKCYKGIAEKITEYVTEDDVILECACGTGLLTLPMARRCKKLIATDYSVGMLRQTKKKVAKYSNTKVRKASILDLPFKDDKFDVVVAANVIHLLDEPDKAILELKRVCKPNGKIILPVYINKEKKNSILAAKVLSALGVKFKRQFSLDSYKEFIASHNISQVEYSVVEGHMPCAFAIITNC